MKRFPALLLFAMLALALALCSCNVEQLGTFSISIAELPVPSGEGSSQLVPVRYVINARNKQSGESIYRTITSRTYEQDNVSAGTWTVSVSAYSSTGIEISNSGGDKTFEVTEGGYECHEIEMRYVMGVVHLCLTVNRKTNPTDTCKFYFNNGYGDLFLQDYERPGGSSTYNYRMYVTNSYYNKQTSYRIVLLDSQGDTILEKSYPVKIDSTNAGTIVSLVDSTVYTMTAYPSSDVASGEVQSGTLVTLSCATDGATVYCTTDGTSPALDTSTSRFAYTEPISITQTTTLKVCAMPPEGSALLRSDVAVFEYTV